MIHGRYVLLQMAWCLLCVERKKALDVDAEEKEVFAPACV
jgi:hypothetical protein